MRTDFVLDALEQTLYARRPERDGSLICYLDRGSQCVSIPYTERLAEGGIEPSVGSKGDSYENALAQTINGLYMAKLIHRRAPWNHRESTGPDCNVCPDEERRPAVEACAMKRTIASTISVSREPSLGVVARISNGKAKTIERSLRVLLRICGSLQEGEDA